MKINNSTLEKVGNQNPFRVPEGYFENLTARIMDSLPEKEAKKETVKISLQKRMTPWLYVAAMLCGITFGIRFFVNYNQRETDNLSTVQKKSEPISLSEDDIMLSSVSNYELYEYLYENDNNF